jgi:hypothetical protein
MQFIAPHGLNLLTRILMEDCSWHFCGFTSATSWPRLSSEFSPADNSDPDFMIMLVQSSNEIRKCVSERVNSILIEEKDTRSKDGYNSGFCALQDWPEDLSPWYMGVDSERYHPIFSLRYHASGIPSRRVRAFPYKSFSITI